MQSTAFALDVVYPAKKYVRINSPATFFVGSVNRGERLFINDEEINVHRTGAFAQQVKLKAGLNEFVLKSDNKILSYTIERSLSGGSYKQAVFRFFEYPLNVEILRDGAPLRTTAVQNGINRISALPIQIISLFL